MAYRSDRDLNLVSFIKPRDDKDFSDKYFLRVRGTTRGVLHPYVITDPILPVPEGSRIVCIRASPLSAYDRTSIHSPMRRPNSREVVRTGILKGRIIDWILYVVTPLELIDDVECEMLFERAQIPHSAIFGGAETLNRVVQLTGRKMTPKDLLARLMTKDTPTTFAKLLLKRSSLGYNFLDTFVLRALCNGAIGENELVSALEGECHRACLACGVSAGKAFSATFKMADDYYRVPSWAVLIAVREALCSEGLATPRCQSKQLGHTRGQRNPVASEEVSLGVSPHRQLHSLCELGRTCMSSLSLYGSLLCFLEETDRVGCPKISSLSSPTMFFPL